MAFFVALALVAVVLLAKCPGATTSAAPPDATAVVVVPTNPVPDAARPVPVPATVDAAPAPIDAAPGPKHHTQKALVDAAPAVHVVKAPPPDAGVAAPPPAGDGMITITAKPFGLVHIDGNDWGTTPVLKRKISVGSHTVDVISPDDGSSRLHKTVTIQQGKLTRVDLGP